MTNGGRLSSGILATIGGSFATFFGLIEMMAYYSTTSDMWLFFLGFAGLTGGILLLCDVMAGGIIALIAGGIGIFFSAFSVTCSLGFFMAIFYSLILSSGITGIASGSEV